MESEYDQKFEKLKKYIPFLDSMIRRLENLGLASNPRQAQLDKLRSLRGILLVKKKRLTMENLAKCEQVLINLHAKIEQRDLNSIAATENASSETDNTHLEAVRNKLKSVVSKLNLQDNKGTLPEIAGVSKVEEVCVPGSKEPALFQRRPNKGISLGSSNQTVSSVTETQQSKNNYTRVLHSPGVDDDRCWSIREKESNNVPFRRRLPRRDTLSYNKEERKKSIQIDKHGEIKKFNITLKLSEESFSSLNTKDMRSRNINCKYDEVDINTLWELKSQILGELKNTDDVSDIILKSYKKKNKNKKNDEMDDGELSESETEVIQSINSCLVVMDKDENTVNLVNEISNDEDPRENQICLVVNNKQIESNISQENIAVHNHIKVDITDFESYHNDDKHNDCIENKNSNVINEQSISDAKTHDESVSTKLYSPGQFSVDEVSNSTNTNETKIKTTLNTPSNEITKQEINDNNQLISDDIEDGELSDNESKVIQSVNSTLVVMDKDKNTVNLVNETSNDEDPRKYQICLVVNNKQIKPNIFKENIDVHNPIKVDITDFESYHNDDKHNDCIENKNSNVINEQSISDAKTNDEIVSTKLYSPGQFSVDEVSNSTNTNETKIKTTLNTQSNEITKQEINDNNQLISDDIEDGELSDSESEVIQSVDSTLVVMDKDENTVNLVNETSNDEDPRKYQICLVVNNKQIPQSVDVTNTNEIKIKTTLNTTSNEITKREINDNNQLIPDDIEDGKLSDSESGVIQSVDSTSVVMDKDENTVNLVNEISNDEDPRKNQICLVVNNKQIESNISQENIAVHNPIKVDITDFESYRNDDKHNDCKENKNSNVINEQSISDAKTNDESVSTKLYSPRQFSVDEVSNSTNTNETKIKAPLNTQSNEITKQEINDNNQFISDDIEDGELSDSESEVIQSINSTLVVMDKDKNTVNLVNETSNDEDSRKYQICLVVNNNRMKSNNSKENIDVHNPIKVDITDFESYPNDDKHNDCIENKNSNVINEQSISDAKTHDESVSTKLYSPGQFSVDEVSNSTNTNETKIKTTLNTQSNEITKQEINDNNQLISDDIEDGELSDSKSEVIQSVDSTLVVIDKDENTMNFLNETSNDEDPRKYQICLVVNNKQIPQSVDVTNTNETKIKTTLNTQSNEITKQEINDNNQLISDDIEDGELSDSKSEVIQSVDSTLVVIDKDENTVNFLNETSNDEDPRKYHICLVVNNKQIPQSVDVTNTNEIKIKTTLNTQSNEITKQEINDNNQLISDDIEDGELSDSKSEVIQSVDSTLVVIDKDENTVNFLNETSNDEDPRKYQICLVVNNKQIPQSVDVTNTNETKIKTTLNTQSNEITKQEINDNNQLISDDIEDGELSDSESEVIQSVDSTLVVIDKDENTMNFLNETSNDEDPRKYQICLVVNNKQILQSVDVTNTNEIKIKTTLNTPSNEITKQEINDNNQLISDDIEDGELSDSESEVIQSVDSTLVVMDKDENIVNLVNEISNDEDPRKNQICLVVNNKQILKSVDVTNTNEIKIKTTLNTPSNEITKQEINDNNQLISDDIEDGELSDSESEVIQSVDSTPVVMDKDENIVNLVNETSNDEDPRKYQICLVVNNKQIPQSVDVTNTNETKIKTTLNTQSNEITKQEINDNNQLISDDIEDGELSDSESEVIQSVDSTLVVIDKDENTMNFLNETSNDEDPRKYQICLVVNNKQILQSVDVTNTNEIKIKTTLNTPSNEITKQEINDNNQLISDDIEDGELSDSESEVIQSVDSTPVVMDKDENIVNLVNEISNDEDPRKNQICLVVNNKQILKSVDVTNTNEIKIKTTLNTPSNEITKQEINDNNQLISDDIEDGELSDSKSEVIQSVDSTPVVMDKDENIVNLVNETSNDEDPCKYQICLVVNNKQIKPNIFKENIDVHNPIKVDITDFESYHNDDKHNDCIENKNSNVINEQSISDAKTNDESVSTKLYSPGQFSVDEVSNSTNTNETKIKAPLNTQSNEITKQEINDNNQFISDDIEDGELSDSESEVIQGINSTLVVMDKDKNTMNLVNETSNDEDPRKYQICLVVNNKQIKPNIFKENIDVHNPIKVDITDFESYHNDDKHNDCIENKNSNVINEQSISDTKTNDESVFPKFYSPGQSSVDEVSNVFVDSTNTNKTKIKTTLNTQSNEIMEQEINGNHQLISDDKENGELSDSESEVIIQSVNSSLVVMDQDKNTVNSVNKTSIDEAPSKIKICLVINNKQIKSSISKEDIDVHNPIKVDITDFESYHNDDKHNDCVENKNSNVINKQSISDTKTNNESVSPKFNSPGQSSVDEVGNVFVDSTNTNETKIKTTLNTQSNEIMEQKINDNHQLISDDLEYVEVSDSESEVIIQSVNSCLVVMDKDKNTVNLVNKTSNDEDSRKNQICLILNNKQIKSNIFKENIDLNNPIKEDITDFESYHDDKHNDCIENKNSNVINEQSISDAKTNDESVFTKLYSPEQYPVVEVSNSTNKNETKITTTLNMQCNEITKQEINYNNQLICCTVENGKGNVTCATKHTLNTGNYHPEWDNTMESTESYQHEWHDTKKKNDKRIPVWEDNVQNIEHYQPARHDPRKNIEKRIIPIWEDSRIMNNFGSRDISYRGNNPDSYQQNYKDRYRYDNRESYNRPDCPQTPIHSFDHLDCPSTPKPSLRKSDLPMARVHPSDRSDFKKSISQYSIYSDSRQIRDSDVNNRDDGKHRRFSNDRNYNTHSYRLIQNNNRSMNKSDFSQQDRKEHSMARYNRKSQYRDSSVGKSYKNKKNIKTTLNMQSDKITKQKINQHKWEDTKKKFDMRIPVWEDNVQNIEHYHPARHDPRKNIEKRIIPIWEDSRIMNNFGSRDISYRGNNVDSYQQNYKDRYRYDNRESYNRPDCPQTPIHSFDRLDCPSTPKPSLRKSDLPMAPVHPFDRSDFKRSLSQYSINSDPRRIRDSDCNNRDDGKHRRFSSDRNLNTHSYRPIQNNRSMKKSNFSQQDRRQHSMGRYDRKSQYRDSSVGKPYDEDIESDKFLYYKHSREKSDNYHEKNLKNNSDYHRREYRNYEVEKSSTRHLSLNKSASMSASDMTEKRNGESLTFDESTKKTLKNHDAEEDKKDNFDTRRLRAASVGRALVRDNITSNIESQFELDKKIITKGNEYKRDSSRRAASVEREHVNVTKKFRDIKEDFKSFKIIFDSKSCYKVSQYKENRKAAEVASSCDLLMKKHNSETRKSSSTCHSLKDNKRIPRLRDDKCRDDNTRKDARKSRWNDTKNYEIFYSSDNISKGKALPLRYGVKNYKIPKKRTSTDTDISEATETTKYSTSIDATISTKLVKDSSHDSNKTTINAEKSMHGTSKLIIPCNVEEQNAKIKNIAADVKETFSNSDSSEANTKKEKSKYKLSEDSNDNIKKIDTQSAKKLLNNEDKPSKQTFIKTRKMRKRIISVSESDSDESNNVNEKGHKPEISTDNVSIQYKLSEDSNDNIKKRGTRSAKKLLNNEDKPSKETFGKIRKMRKRILCVSDSDSDESNNVNEKGHKPEISNVSNVSIQIKSNDNEGNMLEKIKIRPEKDITQKLDVQDSEIKDFACQNNNSYLVRRKNSDFANVEKIEYKSTQNVSTVYEEKYECNDIIKDNPVSTANSTIKPSHEKSEAIVPKIGETANAVFENSVLLSTAKTENMKPKKPAITQKKNTLKNFQLKIKKMSRELKSLNFPGKKKSRLLKMNYEEANERNDSIVQKCNDTVENTQNEYIKKKAFKEKGKLIDSSGNVVLESKINKQYLSIRLGLKSKTKEKKIKIQGGVQAGIIKNKNRRKHFVSSDAHVSLINVKIPDFECFTDKSYCFKSKTSTYSCRLCNYTGSDIVPHYIKHHPHTEIPLSRFSPSAATRAIKQCDLVNFQAIRKMPTDKYTCMFCYKNFVKKELKEFFWHVVSMHTGEYVPTTPELHQCLECLDTAKCPFIIDIPPPPAYAKGQLLGYICGKCHFTQVSRKNLKTHVIKRHNDEKTKVYIISLSRLSKKAILNYLKDLHTQNPTLQGEEPRTLGNTQSKQNVTECSNDGIKSNEKSKSPPESVRNIQSQLTFKGDNLDKISYSKLLTIDTAHETRKDPLDSDVLNKDVEINNPEEMQIEGEQVPSSDIFSYPHFKIQYTTNGLKEYVCCINGNDNHYKTTHFISMKRHIQLKHSENWDGYCFMCKVIVTPQGKHQFKDCLHHYFDKHIDNFPIANNAVAYKDLEHDQVIEATIKNKCIIDPVKTGYQKPPCKIVSTHNEFKKLDKSNTGMPIRESVKSLRTADQSLPSPSYPCSGTPKVAVEYKYEEAQADIMSKKHCVVLDTMMTHVNLIQIFKCAGKFCSFTTDSVEEALLHSSTHVRIGGEYALCCVYCNYDASGNAIDLVTHVFKNHGCCPYVCEVCFYRAAASQLVQAHINRVHPDKRARVLRTPVVKGTIEDEICLPRKLAVPFYVCKGDHDTQNPCKFRAYTPSKFFKHMQQRHQNSKEFLCFICSEALLSPSELIHHLKMHSLKLYQCTWCVYGADSETELLKHSSAKHPSKQPKAFLRIITQKQGSNEFKTLPLAHLDKNDITVLDIQPNVFTKNPVREAERAIELEKLIGDTTSMFEATSNSTNFNAGTTESTTKETNKPTEFAPHLAALLIQAPALPTSSPDVAETPLNKRLSPGPSAIMAAVTNIEQNRPNSTQFGILTRDAVYASDDENFIDISEEESSSSTASVSANDAFNIEWLYKCAKCNMILESAQKLIAHVVLCCGANKISCAYCDAKIYKSQIVEHYKAHSRLYPFVGFICPLCNLRFETAVLAKEHFKRFHSDINSNVIWTAQQFSEQAISKSLLQTNKKIVTQTNKIPETRQKRKRSLESKNKTIEPPEKLKKCGPQDIDKQPINPNIYESMNCSLCDFSTKVKLHMVRHWQLHASINPVPRLESNEQHFDKMLNLTSSSTVNRTLDKTNKNDPSPSVTLRVTPDDAGRYPKYVPDKQRYTCGAKGCFYISVDENMLKRHWKTLHSNTNDYHCVHCPPFQQLDTSKPFNALRILGHLKMHDVNLYACSLCPYYHYMRQTLEKHLDEVHKSGQVLIVREENCSPLACTSQTVTTPTMDLKAWHCGLCQFKSLLRPEVVEHCAKLHNSKMQFKCGYCAFRTSNTENITNHQSKSHEGKQEDIFYYYYREGSVPDDTDGTPCWVKQKQKMKASGSKIKTESIR